jgi:uncharacterized protein (TIGR03435 family)
MAVGCAAAVLCALIAAAGLAQAPAAQMPAQATAAKLEFDVASVKPSRPDGGQDMNFPLSSGDSYAPNGGNFIATGMPLTVYIMFAYKLSASQAQAMKQLPFWVRTEKYDIVAKTENHEATKDEMRLMMRSLLAERFGLAVHKETQQVPVYALALAKPGVLGPKLVAHPASEPCDNTPPKPAVDSKAPPAFTTAAGFPVICGGIMGVPLATDTGVISFGARNVTMALFASTLTGVGNLGRPVLDRTGLTGKYDFLLEFAPVRAPSPSDGATAAPPPDTAGPGIEQALKEQLGLKLVSQKGPVDVWVVDHVEHATEN